MVDWFILRLADQAAPPPPELRIMLGVPVRRDQLDQDLHGDGPLEFSGGFVGRPTGDVITVADGELAEIYLVEQADVDESWAFVEALTCDPDEDDVAAC